ncbi:MAG: OsmC family protein [Vicingaceae bacterium]|jgi:putative redox protein
MAQENEHLETFKVKAQGKGWPTKVAIIDTEWSLKLDEPTEEGGSNTGANPMQYFAASLAGCQNEQAQVVAEELSVSITSIDIDLEIDLDLAGFMGMADHSNGSYKKVRMTAVVRGDLTAAQVQELGEKVDNRCPILGLLRSSGCEISSTWGI